MIILPTTDTLRVTTSQAGDVDVYATFFDRTNSANMSPGRQQTNITGATTTTVVSSGSVDRIVRKLSIRNKHASITQVITVLQNDGTNSREIFKATILAGESLSYNERNGFDVFDTMGRRKTVTVTNAGTPITSGYGVVTLGGDVANSNAVANTIADVTGLAFPVTLGKTYWFEFHIIYDAAATTTGSRWSLNGPAFSRLSYESRYSLTTTTETRNALLQAYDLPAASNATSAATTNNWCRIEGVIRPNTDGNVIARFASEVAGSAITAKAGSFVKYFQID